LKSKRQAKLIELIQQREVGTQSELTLLLSEAGFNVTQATVSRDIRELKLTKTPSANGDVKYSMSAALDDQGMERLSRVFSDGFVSMDNAGNILVIRTYNGMANAVAAALDAMRLPEVMGSVAGDDVIFCVARTPEQIVTLMEKLKK
jgi:transcriptional regulator of arginine metabolism